MDGSVRVIISFAAFSVSISMMFTSFMLYLYEKFIS